MLERVRGWCFMALFILLMLGLGLVLGVVQLLDWLLRRTVDNFA